MLAHFINNSPSPLLAQPRSLQVPLRLDLQRQLLSNINIREELLRPVQEPESRDLLPDQLYTLRTRTSESSNPSLRRTFPRLLKKRLPLVPLLSNLPSRVRDSRLLPVPFVNRLGTVQNIDPFRRHLEGDPVTSTLRHSRTALLPFLPNLLLQLNTPLPLFRVQRKRTLSRQTLLLSLQRSPRLKQKTIRTILCCRR